MAWLSDWANRIEITVADTNVDTNLSSFPLLVYLSASSGTGNDDVSIIFDRLGANSKKIAVTTSDGQTQCYVEIERWDNVNEKAWLWVKVPSILASGGATLYIYYDASKADNSTYIGDTGDAAAQNVWDGNFVGVWHMAQDPNGDAANAIKDSTSNANNGTPGGTMTTADLVDSLVGKGIQFDGSDDRIDFNSPAELDDISNITIEANLYLDGWGTDNLGRPLSKIEQNSNGWFVCTRWSNGAIQFSRTRATATGHWRSATNSISLSTQYVIAITYDNALTANDPVFYINGAVSATTELVLPQGAVNTDASSEFWIGATADSGSPYREYRGIVDEVRISDIERPDYWLKATYYSNNDNINSFGSEEDNNVDITAGPITITLLPLGTDIFQVYVVPSPIVLTVSQLGVFNIELVSTPINLTIGGLDSFGLHLQNPIATDWKRHRGEGVWDFTELVNKTRYNIGDEIADSDDPVWDTEFTKTPITTQHDPCGYWHKGVIEAAAAAAVESFEGYIDCTIIDSITFDSTFCMDNSMVHVDGDIYAVVHRRNSSNMFVRTFTINTDGSFGSLIDSWNVDTGVALNGGILHISGTVFAILKSVGWNDALIGTFNIANDGTITKSFIDSTSFTSRVVNSLESFTHVAGHVYAAIFEGYAGSGRIESVTISNAGAVSSVIDSCQYQSAANSYCPSVRRVYDGVLAIAYVTGTAPAKVRVKTLKVSNGLFSVKETLDLGNISTFYYYAEPKIISEISDFDGILVASGDHTYGGYLRTVSVGSDGTGLALLDEKSLDTYVIDVELVNGPANGVIVSYSGPPSVQPVLHLTALTVSSAGIIDILTECSLTYKGGQTTSLVSIVDSEDLYAVAERSGTDDGLVLSFLAR